MRNCAIIKNNIVENVVVLDEKSEPAALKMFFPDCDAIVMVTESTGQAFIGEEYKSEKFVPVKPYSSWLFDEAAWQWIAPKPYPEVADGFFAKWDNDLVDWTVLAFPEPTVTEEPAPTAE